MYKRVLGKKGQILRLLAQYEQAIKILQSIVNIPPDRVCQTWIHVELGESLRLAGRYEEASQELDRALKQDPNNVQALGSKGATLAGLDLYPQALQVLEQASMTPEPDYEFVLGIKAEILCDIAEYEMAAQILNQLTSLNPYSDWFWTLKGWTLTKLAQERFQEAKLAQERFQEARIAYENALKLNPKNLWRYKSVAEILYLLGNKKASNILYTKIIKKMQKQTDLLNFDLLGWSNYRLGHYSTAAKFFIQAISSPDKNSFTSQFDLSLALMRSKRYELGLQEYKKGLDKISNLSKLRQCGLLSIAIIDLEDALSDQRDFNFRQIPEVQEAQSLLEVIYKVNLKEGRKDLRQG
jgi:tetratricopeptide (TPR) repeat protein